MPPAGHLGDNHTEGKQIGAHIQRQALHLFRRHVVGCAEDCSWRRQLRRNLDRCRVGRRQIHQPLGETEVHHLHVTLLGQHDIGGLQVAVQKPAGMSFLERLGHLPGQAKGIGQRHPATLQPAMQGFSDDVFHHQE